MNKYQTPGPASMPSRIPDAGIESAKRRGSGGWPRTIPAAPPEEESIQLGKIARFNFDLISLFVRRRTSYRRRPRSGRSLASLTFIGRPASSLPFNPAIAASE